MIESIQYTKELPDKQFHTYIVKRENSCGDKFKKAAKGFCFYRGYAYLKDRANWELIVQQHAIKANMLTTDSVSWPEHKSDVEQLPVFDAQVAKHVDKNEEVAILNAFPMFLYYYFPENKFHKH
ncbi:hypothetical protein E5358_12790 [Palleniella muris]|uniref:Uncharacterized protein n=1 Tax=Palleniella muris TaxID=3038145 RepID=A0AC61QMI3_9BACT|nr:hypothetical protein [Palleniella muris]TGX80527.1 hypothetical protein E5358_12790 [Palleniella muris]